MINVELGDFAKNINYYFSLGENYFISHNKKTYVLVGEQNDVDREFCQKNDIEIIDIKHRGGTIVLDKTAIGFAHIGRDIDNVFSNKMMFDFVVFLIEKGLDAVLCDNDILIDGYKVASAGKTSFGNETYFTFQFSLKNDRELIEQICTKPMVKVPKGLSDFGLTREDILSFIERTV